MWCLLGGQRGAELPNKLGLRLHGWLDFPALCLVTAEQQLKGNKHHEGLAISKPSCMLPNGFCFVLFCFVL